MKKGTRKIAPAPAPVAPPAPVNTAAQLMDDMSGDTPAWPEMVEIARMESDAVQPLYDALPEDQKAAYDVAGGPTDLGLPDNTALLAKIGRMSTRQRALAMKKYAARLRGE